MYNGSMPPLIIDLHIHSRFARATSKALTVENIYRWCKIKGINIIGTGDFTHPVWRKELKDNLVPAEDGLFKLKDELAAKIDKTLPISVREQKHRFILTVEISNIYKRGDKVRRLHNLIVADGFKSVEKIVSELERIGNLKADGRPILGLDSEELLKITLGVSEKNLFIPAHIWTPWFAMFGSKSGFDTVEEAFGDNAKYIYAVETGLSSDPFMNWRVGSLSGRTLVSNSDAHSLQKLAREANIINCKLSYKDIYDTIKTNDKRMIGTIEFFPQEGMYHHDGHRKCNFSCTPAESKKLKNFCPICKTPLVLGVAYRVDELATETADFIPEKHKKVEYIVPLNEVIAEVEGVKSVSSKTVVNKYEELISLLGDEFHILRNTSLSAIEKAAGTRLKRAIEKMRASDIYVKPGYDGVYGTVKIFDPNKKSNVGQMNLGI